MTLRRMFSRARRSWLGLSLMLGAGALLAPSPSSAQSAAAAFTSGYRWDAMQRQVGKISPAASGTTAPFLAERYTYDADGQLIRTEKGYLAAWQAETVLPVNWTGYTITQQVDVQYDAAGKKITETSSSGGTVYTATQYAYDSADRMTCTVVRMNSATFGALPSDACALGTQGSQGPDRISKSVYDAASQVVQVRKAVGTSLEQAYVTYSYTPNGKQEYVIDANGNRAKFEYDVYDRKAKWIFSALALPTAYNSATQTTSLATAGSLNTADFELYGYDPDGNRTSLTKRDNSTLTWTYDALNRPTVKVVPERTGLGATHTRDVYYGYDLLGRQLYARFDSTIGEGIINGYDAVGRLTSATQAIDGTSRTLTYQYDANGNRTRITFPDANYATYGYDGLDRPTLIQRSGTSTLASYTYGPEGRRTGFNGGITTSYGYDGVSRVTTLSNNPANAAYNNSYGFAYNPASQITQTTRGNDLFAWTRGANVNRNYTANGLNQYTAAGGATFTYDANANLITDGANTYLYDVENRLVALSGSKVAGLRYDPLGRLYEVTGPTGTITRFLYGGDELVSEYDSTNNMLRRYVHGADTAADDPIAWYEGATFTGANERLMRPDSEGSIVLVTDTSGSTALAVNSYDEWGIPGASNAGRFQYTGQAWLAELGMYHYKARIYSPTLGRFLQTDPIGYADQVNLYAYVANDPVDRTDFTGELDSSGPLGQALKAAAAEEVAGGGPEDPIADVAAVITIGVGVYNAYEASGDGDRERSARNDAAQGRDRSASSGRQPNATATGLPKPPSGRGSVPPDKRDPQRVATPAQKAEQLAKQGGNCAHCGKTGGTIGHHVVRHADGGKIRDVRVIHEECHRDLHGKCS